MNGKIEQPAIPVEAPIEQLVELKKKLEVFKPSVVQPVVTENSWVAPIEPV